jgi:hypothetical protein
MKNRLTLALVVGLAAAGLILGSLPAQAASLSWADPKGDATQVSVADGAPNDPAFDIIKVSMSNDGGTLKWSADIPGIAAGRPSLSTGYFFRFNFKHGESTYSFRVGEDLLGATSLLVSATATGSAALPCDKCVVKFNREAKNVALTVPIASLTRALKAQAGSPPLAGAEWTGLSVTAQRPIQAPAVPGATASASGATLTADQADAPVGTTFAF